MLRSTRFSRHPSSLDYRRGFLVVVTSLVTPSVALASSGTPVAVDFGIYNALLIIRGYLQGPVVKIAGTIAMAGILVGVIVRAQRQESIRSLAAVGVSLLIILNIQEVTGLLGISTGASMASSPSPVELTLQHVSDPLGPHSAVESVSGFAFF